MLNDEPTNTPDPRVFYGWLVSRLFKKPEHVTDVLNRFGPLPQSALRKIVEALDVMSTDWGVARRKKPPLKFADANLKLARLENRLGQVQKEWDELRPLYPAFFTLSIEMIPQNERKEKADRETAAIDLGRATTGMLRIAQKLRDPKKYSAIHRLPHSKSVERAFLWEPLLQLMDKHQVRLDQRGVYIGALKSLHLALGIEPPKAEAVRKMRHDLRQAERSKPRKRYAKPKKRRDV